MPKFFKLFVQKRASDGSLEPVGRRDVTGTIKVSPSKDLKVLRQDILDRGLGRKRAKEAA